MNPFVMFFQTSLLYQTLFVLSLTLSIHGDHDPFSTCPRFDCGKFKQLSYPFRENSHPHHCGLPEFVLNCQSGCDHPVFEVKSQRFLVLDINTTARVLKLEIPDFSDTVCPERFTNTTFDSTPFNYTEKDRNITLLYDCDQPAFPGPPGFHDPWSFNCPIINVSCSVYVMITDSIHEKHPCPSCNISVVVPVLRDKPGPPTPKFNVVEVLKGGFEVKWKAMDKDKCRDCVNSNRSCRFDSTLNDFGCFERPSKRDWKIKIIIGVCAGFGGILIMCIVFLFYKCHKRKKYSSATLLSRSISSNISSAKDVEKGSTYLGVHVFTYEELVAATNNFDSDKELGDGGFGTVYYGKLKDGRAVAVKRLYENNYKRVEQFMNEVEILAHLRHLNLVTLYGCTSRHSHELLLVYEYIPNGTVADHLHGARAKPGALPWAIRLNIAIETASALKYLHASDIIHRDVKTNNILLDSNFGVKVADFGLSRLFPMHVTHISTAPQGTPGYVDPEYHECYQLTSKSDVFSFGVVLMELVSSMPAVDITRHRHDINLSTMAINRIRNHALHELVDPHLGFDSDPIVRKMITAVAELAFQCLQHEKDMRPCMANVLDELKAIQSRDYDPEKTQNINTSADDAVLLKNGPLTFSPDSVTINWTSRKTTPNASS